jgi:hypothetical protein
MMGRQSRLRRLPCQEHFSVDRHPEWSSYNPDPEQLSSCGARRAKPDCRLILYAVPPALAGTVPGPLGAHRCSAAARSTRGVDRRGPPPGPAPPRGPGFASGTTGGEGRLLGAEVLTANAAARPAGVVGRGTTGCRRCPLPAQMSASQRPQERSRRTISQAAPIPSMDHPPPARRRGLPRGSLSAIG